MKILGVEVHNFKRIEAIEIHPSGQVVEVTGRNEQGKSSVLDAIVAALGGKKNTPDAPIRRGAERAQVVLDLGDLIIERVWTGKSDRLVVKSREGATYPKGQARLDELVGRLAFDPLAFMGHKPADQRQTLLELVGVDLDAFDEERQTLYDERRDVNRDLAKAKARAGEYTFGSEPPAGEEVDVADLATKYQEAVTEVAAQERARSSLQKVRDELAEVMARLDTLAAREEELAAEVSAFTDPGAEATKSQLDTAETTNRAIREWKEGEERLAEVEELQAASDSLTRRMHEIDEEKELALGGAEMPVEGLSVGDEGVLFDGLPLEQAALSRRIRICTAISAALNRDLKIALVKNGNDIDDKVLAAFYEEAAAAGLEQVWVERIEGITDGAVEIVEGRLKGEEDERSTAKR